MTMSRVRVAVVAVVAVWRLQVADAGFGAQKAAGERVPAAELSVPLRST